MTDAEIETAAQILFDELWDSWGKQQDAVAIICKHMKLLLAEELGGTDSEQVADSVLVAKVLDLERAVRKAVVLPQPTQREVVVDGLDDRIHKLEKADKGHYELEVIHAKMISAVERKVGQLEGEALESTVSALDQIRERLHKLEDDLHSDHEGRCSLVEKVDLLIDQSGKIMKLEQGRRIHKVLLKELEDCIQMHSDKIQPLQEKADNLKNANHSATNRLAYLEDKLSQFPELEKRLDTLDDKIGPLEAHKSQFGGVEDRLKALWSQMSSLQVTDGRILKNVEKLEKLMGVGPTVGRGQAIGARAKHEFIKVGGSE